MSERLLLEGVGPIDPSISDIEERCHVDPELIVASIGFGISVVGAALGIGLTIAGQLDRIKQDARNESK